MGLDFFAQQCQPQATEADALIWCVKKEGSCCGICPDTLASLGTRVGLTFAVFFATLVISIDGAETPFLFLTTSLQALAYLAVVLWEGGKWGKGISRFHSYYALFCSFGWMAPLAAASVTATHYGYGGNHQRSGIRLPNYSTKYKRIPKRRSIEINSLSHLARKPPEIYSFRSLRSTSPSTRDSQLLRETVPLVETDSSPASSPHSSTLHLQPWRQNTIMGRRRSLRIPDDCKPDFTPATPSLLLFNKEIGGTSHDFDKEAGSAAQHIPRVDTFDTLVDPEGEPNLRRRLTNTSSKRQSTQAHRHDGSRAGEGQAERDSIETKYSPEQLRKIARRVNGGCWRRWGYPLSVLSLWIMWAVAFLLINGTIPSFNLTQTDCPDPEGTELLKYSSLVFLTLGVLIALVFVLNYHTQWLPRRLRQLLDFNRHGSLYTRFLLPGIFSGFVFATWQALLWHGYRLASRPESSLLAATEQSATFATVLSLALTVKPITDLVKAVTKIHKRKLRERREAQHSQSPILPGQTPTVLPDLQLPEIEKLPPLEPPALPMTPAVSRTSSRREAPNLLSTDACPQPRARSRGGSPAATSRGATPSPPDSLPSSQRSSLSSDSVSQEEGQGLRPPRWLQRLSGSSSRSRGRDQ